MKHQVTDGKKYKAQACQSFELLHLFDRKKQHPVFRISGVNQRGRQRQFQCIQWFQINVEAGKIMQNTLPDR